MGERKVQCRYFPPDFDPSLVPKRKWDPYKQVEVRMMIPFSMQCLSCGEFMYRGKKFNSRKEDVIGDDYLGVRKYRFYIRCSACSNEIAFKTDPENNDYTCESGAQRNFESFRDEREEAPPEDAMAALEARALDSKLEIDILDALDHIKTINRRHLEPVALEKVEEDDTDELARFKRDQASLGDERVSLEKPAPTVAKKPAPTVGKKGHVTGPPLKKRLLAPASATAPPAPAPPASLVAYASSDDDASS